MESFRATRRSEKGEAKPIIYYYISFYIIIHYYILLFYIILYYSILLNIIKYYYILF